MYEPILTLIGPTLVAWRPEWGEPPPQRYGSQLMDGPGGELVVAPMEAPEEVDERRAALGLETLAEYLSRFSP